MNAEYKIVQIQIQFKTNWEQFSFSVKSTYILFMYLSSCQVKLKCWTQNTKSQFGLPSGNDSLETKIHTMSDSNFFGFLIFWLLRIHKKVDYSSLYKLYMYFLFWDKIKRLCFVGGVMVVLLVEKRGLWLFWYYSTILLLCFSFFHIPSRSLLFVFWQLLWVSVRHQEAKSLWFMYLIKAMLSNFNFSEGLTTATTSAFYIRQLFHWLWIGQMESVLFLGRMGGRRESQTERRREIDGEDAR